LVDVRLGFECRFARMTRVAWGPTGSRPTRWRGSRAMADEQTRLDVVSDGCQISGTASEVDTHLDRCERGRRSSLTGWPTWRRDSSLACACVHARRRDTFAARDIIRTQSSQRPRAGTRARRRGLSSFPFGLRSVTVSRGLLDKAAAWAATRSATRSATKGSDDRTQVRAPTRLTSRVGGSGARRSHDERLRRSHHEWRRPERSSKSSGRFTLRAHGGE
jgi:hypothetical protein